MKDLNTVTADIKAKFGSIARFADLAELDYEGLRKTFARFRKGMNKEKEKELKNIMKLHDITDPDQVESSRISEEDIELIKIKITKLGGVDVFCEANEEFNRVSIYQILDGTRKRKTNMVKELLVKLKIK